MAGDARIPSLLRNRHSFGVLAVVLLAAVLAGTFAWPRRNTLRRMPAVGDGAWKGYNVVFVTIDTLRADHLPAYGYEGVETPSLDALAAESFVFEDAISSIPLTLPAHTTMLASVEPATHGIPDNGAWLVSPDLVTLPELLKQHGYATGAFVSCFVLDARWQLDQGFDRYYDDFHVPEFVRNNPGLLQRRAEQTWTEADKWITEHKDGPFFAWMHFYDPHQTYDPPEPFRTRYAKQPYDGEIAYVDSVIGKVRARLDALGLTDRTLLVLTSDHGDSLGEHGELTHGILLYDATLHIPLMVRLPGGKARRVPGVARQIDYAPTLLRWLGVEVPAQMQGRSLAGLMDGSDREPRLALSETRFPALHYGWSPLYSLASDQFRYIKAPKPELYDRRADPHETKNLLEAKPVTAAEMAGQLDARMASAVAGVRENERQKVDADTEEKLRALGYLGVAFEDPSALEGTKTINPRDKVHLHELLGMAQTSMQERKDDEARQWLQKVLQEDPGMTEAHYLMGVLAVRAAKPEEAVHEFQLVVAAQPQHVKGLYNLATTLHGLKRYDEAERYFKLVLDIDHHNMPAIVHLGHLYEQSGRPQLARERFLEAEQQYLKTLPTLSDPGRQAEAYARLAEVAFNGGSRERAEAYLRKGIELAPKRPALHYNLALVLEGTDPMAAMDAYLDELEITPDNMRAHRGLGVLLRQEGAINEALAAFNRALEIEPENPETLYRIAETLSDRDPRSAQQYARRAVAAAPRFEEARALLARLDKKVTGGRG